MDLKLPTNKGPRDKLIKELANLVHIQPELLKMIEHVPTREQIEGAQGVPSGYMPRDACVCCIGGGLFACAQACMPQPTPMATERLDDARVDTAMAAYDLATDAAKYFTLVNEGGSLRMGCPCVFMPASISICTRLAEGLRGTHNPISYDDFVRGLATLPEGHVDCRGGKLQTKTLLYELLEQPPPSWTDDLVCTCVEKLLGKGASQDIKFGKGVALCYVAEGQSTLVSRLLQLLFDRGGRHWLTRPATASGNSVLWAALSRPIGGGLDVDALWLLLEATDRKSVV